MNRCQWSLRRRERGELSLFPPSRKLPPARAPHESWKKYFSNVSRASFGKTINCWISEHIPTNWPNFQSLPDTVAIPIAIAWADSHPLKVLLFQWIEWVVKIWIVAISFSFKDGIIIAILCVMSWKALDFLSIYLSLQGGQSAGRGGGLSVRIIVKISFEYLWNICHP